MNEALKLKKLARAPDWVTKWFAEIDSKRFGPGFDACFAPDAEMVFGVTHLKGFKAIKAHLVEFDSKMDTKHVVLDFWDADNTKFLRGQVNMTMHSRPEQTVTPTFVHVWHMSEEDPRKIQRLHGAVGPLG